ncbi:FAD-dependent thymidylate synthase [Eubacteriales bacterium OttesenSCG-928-N13]|nr:FAD-dependent thymidylate synthase [Eubacteriales bacterium OttesenSCG-928-N13]
MQTKGEARFIAMSDHGLNVCAASARISTTDGTALEIFGKGDGGERDLKLIRKVLGSGHKSLLEHHVFSLALENVSVLVEQFLIEFRLASFTVKSRRYVNFSGAGFYVPDSLSGDAREKYVAGMTDRFSDYNQLMALDIPKEDARFVLPYCFLSNFYLTCNARELIHIICSMIYGRGSMFAELVMLGEQLLSQFEAVYPGVIESEKAHYERCAVAPFEGEFHAASAVVPSIKLLSAPADPESLLQGALQFTGRFPDLTLKQAAQALVRDARPRELECLSFTYLVKDVSLASVTHYTRHRMQSPLIKQVIAAVHRGAYIVPDTIAANEQAIRIYQNAFERNHQVLMEMMDMGMSYENASYFALAGNVIDMMITMNARELLHFLKLRTCTRAQWEIQKLSVSLLEQLRTCSHTIFDSFGPSCAVELRCPEGRMSCGKPQFPKDVDA